MAIARGTYDEGVAIARRKVLNVEPFLHEAMALVESGHCLSVFRTGEHIGCVATVPSYALGSEDVWYTTSTILICTNRWDRPQQVREPSDYERIYSMLKRGIDRQSYLLGRLMSIPSEREREILRRESDISERQAIVQHLFTEDTLRRVVNIDRRIEQWGFEEIQEAVVGKALAWGLHNTGEVRFVALEITRIIVHGLYQVSWTDLGNIVRRASEGNSIVPVGEMASVEQMRRDLIRRETNVREQNTDSPTERVLAHDTNQGRENSPVHI